MGRITLKEIAALAGVHKSTVDKVIHNRPGVSDAKRQQIRKLLDEYGYESNPLAKALNYQKKKMKIAVVLPQVNAMPYLKRGMEQVQQDFNSFNIEVVYHEIEGTDAVAQSRYLHRLPEEGVSGVVLLPIEDPLIAGALKSLSAANIPVVTVNSSLTDGPRLCHVEQNAKQSGETAARMLSLLLPNGGAVGLISNQYVRAVKEREDGFVTYLSKLQASDGLPDWPICEALSIQENSEDAYAKTTALLDRHPEIRALFISCGCVSDICRAVRDKGLAGKLTIICYERYPEIVELLKEDVISCAMNGHLFTQGRLSMRLLFEYLVYDKKPEREIYYTTNEILIRENVD